MRGTVKWFDIRKGFGFVTGEDGKDVFVHFSGIKTGRHYVGLNDGDTVEFNTKQGKKGLEVDDLELITDAPTGKKSYTESDEPEDAAKE